MSAVTADKARAFVDADVKRWSLAAAAALALHGFAVYAALFSADPADDEGGLPAIMVELAPVTAAFASPMDLAHGPERIEAPSEERMYETAQPEQKKDEAERTPETAVPDAAVTLPEERKQVAEQPPPTAPAEESPVPTAPPAISAPSAARVATPSPGRAASAATAKWQSLLVAHLHRHKRYPARAGGAEGTAKLAFRIDGKGHLLASRIVVSSGSAALDDETIALVNRAQPFPSPPPSASPEQLSFVIPIRYVRARGP